MGDKLQMEMEKSLQRDLVVREVKSETTSKGRGRARRERHTKKQRPGEVKKKRWRERDVD